MKIKNIVIIMTEIRLMLRKIEDDCFNIWLKINIEYAKRPKIAGKMYKIFFLIFNRCFVLSRLSINLHPIKGLH